MNSISIKYVIREIKTVISFGDYFKGWTSVWMQRGGNWALFYGGCGGDNQAFEGMAKRNSPGSVNEPTTKEIDKV